MSELTQQHYSHEQTEVSNNFQSYEFKSGEQPGHKTGPLRFSKLTSNQFLTSRALRVRAPSCKYHISPATCHGRTVRHPKCHLTHFVKEINILHDLYIEVRHVARSNASQFFPPTH
jgi:hypothetical protein